MSSYNPLVSIVVPAFNAANYLAEAINSALAQTYKNIEIIVVNDGSNDDCATRNVAESFGNKIRYFEKKNGGSSSALNYGIKQMKGEWFSWLSHDDLYYPNKIEREIELIRSLDSKNLKHHVFFSAADYIDKDGKIIRKPKLKTCTAKSEEIESFVNNRKMIATMTDYIFHGCSCLVNRDLFDEIGMFDESLRLVNDAELWFRVYSSGCKIHYLPEILVSGRVHSLQVSRSIGYSYHNSEQDYLWNRRLEWLKKHYPHDYDSFYEYGRNAIEKTRYKEGQIAFEFATNIRPLQWFHLRMVQYILTCKSYFMNVLKKLYLKVKV